MKQDPFLFLSLFGNVDSSYIEQSTMEWNEEGKMTVLSRYHIKIACAIMVLILAGGCIFHTEVKAAVQKVVTMISEMLGIQDDISAFTDQKKIPLTINGLTLTLEEVILDKNELIMLVSQKFQEDEKSVDTELIDNVKINGIEPEILTDYITDTTVDRPAQKYVFEYYLDDDILAKNSHNLEIEAVFTVKNAENENKIGEYRFKFQSSVDELEKENMRIPIDQKIAVAEDIELKFSTLALNSVESNITAKCDDLPLEAEYYLKGNDNYGNEIIYRLASYENSNVVFIKEPECYISLDTQNLELQLYRHNLGNSNQITEDDETVWEENIDDDIEKMEPIGEKFTVNISAYADEESSIQKSGNNNEKGIWHNCEELYKLKNPDLEFNKIKDIIDTLTDMGWWPEEQNWFTGYDSTEVLDISFQKKLKNRDIEEMQMMRIGIVFLTLIDNLEEVDFSYIVDKDCGQIKYDMYIDQDTVKNVLSNEELKTYTESFSTFESLINKLEDLIND